MKLVERKKGEFVAFGNEIQLFHCDSQSFMKSKKLCADVDKSCNKVMVMKQGASSFYFKVLPRYKHRQEGEKILYGD